MSVSRCFRCAADAVQPVTKLNLQTRPLLQTRFYASLPDEPKHHGHAPIGSELKTVGKKETANPESLEQIRHRSRRPSPPIAPQQNGELSSIDEADLGDDGPEKPIPPNVAAAYRTPYKHIAEHGVPVAQLQLRSYSVRNLEFFADFVMRVAYYLKLPATGPAPLPKRIERWTMPRSNFVHKKSQENFERITLKRLITVYDGHPDVVEIWLACLRKWQFYGVGMKANVWAFEGVDVASNMDRQLEEVQKDLDAKLANFGWRQYAAGKQSVEEMLRRQGARIPGATMSLVRDKIAGVKNVDLFKHVTDDMQRRKI
ncbi:mitochondrial 37S ribosomal protein rsm10 [Lithohypha guttulata]|uniref:Small ribosomal subunit protein uS10m n=1 Tax=Lithohypha guttulata TaxID=1690604 RepID=A0AAN7T5R1_9EURO|nr:mitochondrial 37S ribosomal protein rsm10 [Lithohypha guttulata]KAK5089944.1 mitochondrial 37S ribosomal protein rsm10 [Lithohypha guttulata]